MKKEYLEPTAEMVSVVTKTAFICASYTGKSTTDLTIVDSTNEDDWEY